MTRKISLRFILYFLGFYALLVILSLILIITFLSKSMSASNIYTLYENIRDLDDDFVEMFMDEEKNDTYSFSNEFAEFATYNHGFLQLLDEKGNVIVSTDTEQLLPKAYSSIDLTKFHASSKNHMWSFRDGMTILFTELTPSDLLLKTLKQSKEFPHVTEKQLQLLQREHATFTLYDEDGTVIFTSDEQNAIPMDHFHASPYSLINEEQLHSLHFFEDNSVVAVHVPNEYYISTKDINKQIIKYILIGLGVFHGILLVVIIVFSLLIGRRFGRPILYFLKRIERLAKGKYETLNDEKIRAKNTHALKKKYRMYEDVDESLTTLATNLKRNDAKIKQTEQLREDWITGLSHDLKTPLSTVLGYAIMLKSSHEWTKEETLHFATVITEKANYMDVLIDDLTYTYQLKNKGIQLEKNIVNINEYVQHVIDNKAMMNIEFIPSEREPFVAIDETRFARVLENIISNAVIHNPVDTSIHITISVSTYDVLIEVSDDGMGMDAHTVEHLFNRYYRGTNTTSDSSGTGLGLTIAKQLIEAHDGTIKVRSSNEGTTISIYLPIQK